MRHVMQAFPAEKVIAIDGRSWTSVTLKRNYFKEMLYKPIILAMEIHEQQCILKKKGSLDMYGSSWMVSSGFFWYKNDKDL